MLFIIEEIRQVFFTISFVVENNCKMSFTNYDYNLIMRDGFINIIYILIIIISILSIIIIILIIKNIIKKNK